LDGEKSNLFEKQPRALSTNNKMLLKRNVEHFKAENLGRLR